MGKGKKLRASQPPAAGKHILPHAAASEGSTNHLKPEFNLEFLGGRYCLSACDKDEKAAFADTLYKLSRMTWGEIQRADRHGSGHETIERHRLRGPSLPAEATEDVKILAFRFCGKEAMVGYRRGRVFVVLFLDRDFTLYDHGT